MQWLLTLLSISVCSPDVVCATGIESLGAILTAVSAAMSVVSGIASSNQNKQNALNAKADAEQAMVQGEAEKARQERINRARQSELVAAQGASGTLMTGSPMEVYLENAKQASMEAQDPLYGAKLKNRSLSAQAKLYNKQATSSLFEGFGNAAGKLSGLGSTLVKPSVPDKKPKPDAGAFNYEEDYF